MPERAQKPAGQKRSTKGEEKDVRVEADLVEPGEPFMSRPLTLDQLACEAGLHRCHFARELRRHRGMSAGDYRRRLRVALAAKKLSLTCLALAEIAHELGFADQSHMGASSNALSHMGASSNALSA